MFVTDDHEAGMGLVKIAGVRIGECIGMWQDCHMLLGDVYRKSRRYSWRRC
jgi:hypothetical protein